ncbi:MULTISPECIES: hypothetical protein [Ehrlichia]|uniref:Putative membrane protein n=1 Tax=Ehrlichia cf. muris str. EmCRT TaxID=1359167 RepID=A0A0F3N6E0_9RICK|nr:MULTISPECIES: hypothetical protein [Ehrlichia]KJV63296.1 putative membrane protein [Ehrlichia cf. muris str. EmCRT]OUC04268.1 hypothetical protein DB91_03130 [Ehrlichia sp. Wisconsin_h]
MVAMENMEWSCNFEPLVRASSTCHPGGVARVSSKYTPLKSRKTSAGMYYGRLFVMISFIALVIDAASSMFNLISTHVFVSERIKHMVAAAFYIIYTIAALVMIVSSVMAIKESVNNKKLTQNSPETSDEESDEESINDSTERGKLIKKQANIQISENSFTIISQLMWVIVSVVSLTMLSIGSNPALEQLSLFLSVTAPFLGILSCILRLVDANISRETGNSEKQKRRARSFTILCAVILAFEIVHCICHVLEALSLGGKMQDIYSFQNTAVLCLELITVLAFIAAFFIEKYIDSKAEKSQAHSVGVSSFVDHVESDPHTSTMKIYY